MACAQAKQAHNQTPTTEGAAVVAETQRLLQEETRIQDAELVLAKAEYEATRDMPQKEEDEEEYCYHKEKYGAVREKSAPPASPKRTSRTSAFDGDGGGWGGGGDGGGGDDAGDDGEGGGVSRDQFSMIMQKLDELTMEVKELRMEVRGGGRGQAPQNWGLNGGLNGEHPPQKGEGERAARFAPPPPPSASASASAAASLKRPSPTIGPTIVSPRNHVASNTTNPEVDFNIRW
jgi:hypothetical protein